METEFFISLQSFEKQDFDVLSFNRNTEITNGLTNEDQFDLSLAT